VQRKAILILFALLFAGTAFAQVYQITTRTIEMDVDGRGNAEITEKFFLSFPNDFYLQEFRSKSAELGVDLEEWQQFNPGFKPSIGDSTDVVVSDIGFVETDSRYMELKYHLNEPIMGREMETSRMVEFALKSKFFNNFLEGSFWVIPTNVTIIVDLPLQVEIQPPVRPEANVSGNRIVWTGYKSTNQLSLKYTQWKEIASLDLNELATAIAKSELFPLLVIAVLLLVIGVFAKRKAITAKIEGYIIAHSSFSAEDEEEQ